MTQDLAFEALMEVCGIDYASITKDQRGRINAALKQLREVYPDDVTLPDMIRGRAQAWSLTYPLIPLTPQALTANWASILDAAEKKQREERKQEERTRRQINAPMTGRDCPDCHGDKMVVVGQDLHGADECAPCPSCNPDADASYWTLGKQHVPLSPEMTRARIRA